MKRTGTISDDNVSEEAKAVAEERTRTPGTKQVHYLGFEFQYSTLRSQAQA